MLEWATIIGLVLDIIGFLILAYEWHQAIKQSQAGEVEASVNRGQWGLSEDEQVVMRPGIIAEVAARYSTRKWVFRLGALLIVLGFLGQIIGSWPRN